MKELIISEYHRLAETREQGRSFYPVLLDWATNAPQDSELVISFEDLEFLSASFVDETIVRLIEEHTELVRRLRLSFVDAFTLRILRSVFAARGISNHIPTYEPA